jgi:tudor domain-containing protein 1/4/6/7
MAGVSNLSMVVQVTNIEDSVHGRQSPYVYFWGTTDDRILMMNKYIESIRNSIENRPPPMDVKELSGVFCVLKFHEWRRAKVLQPILSHTGTLEVFLIDYGHSHTAPLVFLRTLDIPGTASEYVRKMPDLATKYLLAVLAPQGCDSPYYWSEPAMMYLKLNVNDRPWKATSMGMCCGHQCLRLFTYANDHLLATLMIEQGLGVPSHTYSEALSVCKILQEQPVATFSAGHNIDNKENEKAISSQTKSP